MRTARSFARYLSTIDSVSEIPPADLFPSRSHRPTPYIYRDDEIVALMDGARKLAPPIKAATLETLIGLLAATGMRVGEAVSLEHRDVDWGEGLITVRHAKFNKSREVLLHSSVIAALERYAHQRDRLVASAPTFFVSSWGCFLSYKKVQPAFREMCNRVLENASCRPRLHDLRHSFAVNTLLSWYRDGGDVASRLPLLSTYLGHVDPAATYWYLSAVPELLNLAAQRLEQS
jgi:integrase